MRPRWVRLSVSLFTQHVDILETQMFATFIDHKIMSQWQDPEQSIRVFDLRNNAKVGSGHDSSGSDSERTSYDRCMSLDATGKSIHPLPPSSTCQRLTRGLLRSCIYVSMPLAHKSLGSAVLPASILAALVATFYGLSSQMCYQNHCRLTVCIKTWSWPTDVKVDSSKNK